MMLTKIKKKAIKRCLLGKLRDQKGGRGGKADRNSNVGTLNTCSTAHKRVKYWLGKLI